MSIAITDTRSPRKQPAQGSGDDSRLHSIDVLVIDDDPDASYSLCALLGWQLDIRVTATGSTQAVAAVRAQRPAVTLVSAELGPRFVFGLTQLSDAPRVLVHASFRRPDVDGVAVLAGATGSVWRYDDPDELADTVRLVAAGWQPPEPSSDAVMHVIDRLDDCDRPIAAMLLHRTPIDKIARVLGSSARRIRDRHREIVKQLDNAAR